MKKKALGALFIAAMVIIGVFVAPTGASALPTSTTKIGAWSQYGSWTAFNAGAGQMDVYRGYDNGFHYATWQQVPAGHRYRGPQNLDTVINDYSFQIPPAQLMAGTFDAQLRTFIASTPKNIVLTNQHEPEQEIQAGHFTFAQFRAANVRLNQLVDAQNALDGGTRKVSVILMISTFTGFQGRNAENYWPTAAKGDGGTVDLISADVYAAPHATGTPGVPLGYTDGVNWKTAQGLVKPVLSFAKAHATDWAISELGILEDVNNPGRKAQLMTDVVNYARAGRLTPTGAVYRPALWVSYWNSKGGRADWGLRFSNPPVPSETTNSLAYQTWRTLRNQP
jgi:hypothetical protein